MPPNQNPGQAVPPNQPPAPGNETPPQSQSPADPVQAPKPASGYDFIINPQKPAPKRSLPGSGQSLPVKIGFAAGGLIILAILFSFIRGALGPKTDFEPFMGVLQDQQAMILIVQSAEEQKELTAANSNFVVTSKLSLGSSQSEILSYLQKNGEKVNKKSLNAKVSAKTGEQLKTAVAAANYNETLKEVMKTRLNTYVSDLNTAYKQFPGTKGKALLINDYKQAKLLLKQLETPQQ